MYMYVCICMYVYVCMYMYVCYKLFYTSFYELFIYLVIKLLLLSINFPVDSNTYIGVFTNLIKYSPLQKPR
jgi:hypothetical protein